MKKSLITARILVTLFAAALLNGCSKENEAVTPKTKQSSQSVQAGPLTEAQIADLNARADQIANESLKALKSKSNMRASTNQDFVVLNVNGVTPTGPSAATYSFSTYIQTSIAPSLAANYNYVYCAAAGHLRYGVFYLYNGYTHTMVSKGSVTGPTGGCLSGGVNFSENFPGPNTSQGFLVVFDVLNGPGGGSTQFAQLWSNQRDLYYPGLSVYGSYWY